jgi:hypothetical protein
MFKNALYTVLYVPGTCDLVPYTVLYFKPCLHGACENMRISSPFILTLFLRTLFNTVVYACSPSDIILPRGRYRNEPRARICKPFRSPGIDSKESIPPAYVAWRARTSNRVVVPARQAGNRFLGSLKGYKIRALDCCRIALAARRTVGFLTTVFHKQELIFQS